MKVVKMNIRKEPPKIRLRDIPLVVTMGDLCENVSRLFEIMKLINKGRANDAFWIADDLIKKNSALIDEQIDREAVQKILDREFNNQNINKQ